MPTWVEHFIQAVVAGLLIHVGWKAWERRGELTRPVTGVSRSPADLLVGGSYAVICAIVWSLSYVSLSFVSRRLSAIDITLWLLGFAALFLRIAAFFGRRDPAEAGVVIVWSSLGVWLVAANLGNFVFSVFALRFTSASQAMTLNNMFPLFLALILLFRRRITFSGTTLATVVLVCVGAWVVHADSKFSFKEESELLGSLLAILGGISFAIWADRVYELERLMPSISTRLDSLSRVFLSSYVLVLTAAYLWVPEHVSRNWSDWLILVGNGVRIAAVYVLFQFAVKKAGPLLPTTIVVLQVPLTIVWDHWLLGTPTTSRLIVGAVAITAGAAALLMDEIQKARPAAS